MSKPVTLQSPRYRVVVGDPAETDTWQELEVQALTRDLASAETLFAKRKWGSPSEHPIKLTAVSAYMALLRTGQVEGSWDAFEAQYLEVTEAGADTVGPTVPDQGPDF
jgi:hypothetical protein